jgi:oligogalacturonide lyase
LYFTNPGWWDNGRRLLFGSDRMGRANLFSVELESGEITQHTDKDMPGPPRETSFLFAAVNPCRSECYFWRGEKLIAVDLLSNRERTLWSCPAAYLPNILNVSADGLHIYSVIYQDLSDRFPVDLLNGYVGFREYCEARPHSQIVRVAVDSRAMDVVWEEHSWIGHVNTSPVRPDLLSFCHEGPWDIVDNRIWMLDLAQSKAWAVRRPSPGEVIGHEYWHADGVTIGYHGHRAETGGFFGFVNYDNTNVREFPAQGETGHIHSLNTNLIVGDAGAHVRLWARDGSEFGKSRLLCRHGSTSKIQQLHVHPRFSPDGSKVVFTSDRTGYGQVYEVEVGDWRDLPVAE